MNILSRYTLMTIAVGCLSVLGASAQTNAVSFTNTTGESLGNGPFTLGWSFTANSNINIVDLGVFDDSQNGLAESHAVGVWDSSGNLLVSATVPSGTSATLDDQFRMVGVSSTALTAGQQYFIGAVFIDGADPNLFPGDATNFATASQLTFDANQYVAGATLSDPIFSAGTDPAYFGPQFEFTATPEPGSFALLGTGLLGFAGVMRRRLS